MLNISKIQSSEEGVLGKEDEDNISSPYSNMVTGVDD
jgi:hypothetical protein